MKLLAGKYLRIVTIVRAAHEMRWVPNDPRMRVYAYPCNGRCSERSGTFVDSPIVVAIQLAPDSVEVIPPQTISRPIHWTGNCIGGFVLTECRAIPGRFQCDAAASLAIKPAQDRTKVTAARRDTKPLWAEHEGSGSHTRTVTHTGRASPLSRRSHRMSWSERGGLCGSPATAASAPERPCGVPGPNANLQFPRISKSSSRPDRFGWGDSC